jgi:eukaryotic-like serine/threonine-protein kinase
MALSAGARVGAYEIVGLLGAGGMGEVYRARDSRLRRDVAIKVLPELSALDPDRLARFEREAQVLATLNHPQIAAIYGFEDSGTGAIIMELVDGPTLADRIAQGPVPIAEALGIAEQIASALEAAHDKGIVHRDLKPANVKLTAEGSVKVLDFGLAKALTAESAPPHLSRSPTVTDAGTRAGVVLGTAAYMSPEQARGQAVDRRTDIWAFGCVLYELLTARHAFAGDTVSDLLAAILTREPDVSLLPAETPPAIRRLLRRSLEKDPRRRLHDAADARLEIEDAVEELRQPRPEAAAPEVERRLGIWRAAAMTLTASLLAVVLTMAWLRPKTAEGPASRTNLATTTQLTDYGGREGDGAISPDGRSFVFVSDHDGTLDLWTRKVSGGNPVRLTDDPGEEAQPVFSPDGEAVYFTRIVDGVESIWRVAAMGGAPRKVIEQARMAAPSPDGGSIAYLTSPGPSDLMVAALDGSGARVLQRGIPPGVGSERPRWSPEGRWISYNRWQLFGPSNLWLVDARSGEARQATHFTGTNQGIGSHVWLPDSRHIAMTYWPVWEGVVASGTLGIFDIESGAITRLTIRVTENLGSLSASADGTRLLATASQARSDVWKIPATGEPLANGRGARRVLDSTYGAGWTFVSRDGTVLLFSGRGRDLWTLALDRPSTPAQITTLVGQGAYHSSLSPDGSRVAFVSSGQGPSDIWVQHVDGSGLRQLTRDDAADTWPVWLPDGRSIVFGSRRDGAPGIWRMSADGAEPQRIMDGFFRGDATDRAEGGRTLLVTSSQTSDDNLRLIDLEKRTVVWRRRIPGINFSLPVFASDGRAISLLVQESRVRDAIWVLDTATGNHRVAVRFEEPFDMTFRASWVDHDSAFVVNRRQETSHVVLFDQFWSAP